MNQSAYERGAALRRKVMGEQHVAKRGASPDRYTRHNPPYFGRAFRTTPCEPKPGGTESGGLGGSTVTPASDCRNSAVVPSIVVPSFVVPSIVVP